VIPPLEDRLAAAEAMIREASLSPVPELPALLSRVVAIVDDVCGATQAAPPPDRDLAVARLKAFQARMGSFSAAMRRSEAIFQGYARHAGVSLNEYGPGGVANGARDPAFVNLTL
jgi:hypothetical protein